MPADRRKLIAHEMSAPSDYYGNPRHVYVVMSREGRTVDVLDIGYAGRSALTDGRNPGGWRYPNAVEGAHFNITGREYRRLLRWFTRS